MNSTTDIEHNKQLFAQLKYILLLLVAWGLGLNS